MKRVLVVDDEENIRVVLRALLRKNGYEVEVADSGESALALVDTFGPDVILTDVRMPKMGGLDLLATLRATGWKPVRSVTSWTRTETAPYAFVPIGANSRSATSRCTITHHRSTDGIESSDSATSGVAIE